MCTVIFSSKVKVGDNDIKFFIWDTNQETTIATYLGLSLRKNGLRTEMTVKRGTASI